MLLVLIVPSFWDPGRRNLTQVAIPSVLRNFLVSRENGSYCRIDFRKSELWFSFERAGGTDTDADISLRIPRSEVSEERIEAIVGAFDRNGFKFVAADNDNLSLIGEVRIHIDDIWDEASGAPGAHAARILMAELGLPVDATFNVTEVGKASSRLFGEHADTRN